MPHLYAPTQLKPAGTRSYRLASSQLFDLGINSQNYDKESADIYEAPPGWSFFQRDQAGAEALVVAYEAKAGRYRALFENKLKPHTYVALHLFLDKFRKAHPRDRYWLRTAPELQALPEWAELSNYIQKKSKFEYDIGKRTGHASNYKMGPNTFREQALKESEGSLIMTFDEAKYYLDIYKQLFPEIVEWQIEIEHEIRTKRLLRNLFGFPRSFERLITDSYIREAISWIPQSTVGCITHRAYRATFDYVQAHKLPWRLVSNKHDSYAVLAPDSEQEHVRAIMAKHIGLHLVGKRGEFTMVSDFQVGKNLKKYHETENPLGMREL